MNIELNNIKLLREKTGAGIASCKNALHETNGNFEQALMLLKKKCLDVATKKLDRVTIQGIVNCYIHTGAKLGVLIELNCETDFVARKTEFQTLAYNLALQIAANDNIQYIDINQIPKNRWDLQYQVENDNLKNIGENNRESIVKIKVEEFFKNYTLLNQPYIHDSTISVEEVIKSNIAFFGENIKIARFCKFKVGEQQF